MKYALLPPAALVFTGLRFTTLSFAVLTVLLAGSVPAANAQSQSRSQQKADGEASVLKDAVTALAEEFKAAASGRPPSLPRTEADYFEKPPAGVTNEQVLTYLGRRLDRNPSVDGYIKWQLSGALRAPLSEAEQRLAARIVSEPARYTPHPSLGQERQLDSILRQVTEDQVPQVNQQWAERVAGVEMLVTPTMRFREAMLSSLPDAPPVFRLWLSDFEARHRAGWESDDAMKTLAARIRSWQGSANPQARQQVLTMLQQHMQAGEAKVYHELIAKPEDNKRQIQWGQTTVKANSRSIKSLLEQLSTDPADGALKFGD